MMSASSPRRPQLRRSRLPRHSRRRISSGAAVVDDMVACCFIAPRVNGRGVGDGQAGGGG